MNMHAFFASAAAPSGPSAEALPGAPAAERQEGAWRVLPLEGTFDLVYEDGTGAWSARRLEARELKLGPGRTLIGGIDRGRGGYRGFRVDRIRRLTDGATGQRVETGILDLLLGRAEAQRRERAALARRVAGRARRAAPRRAA
ncbi:hypothetical protein MOX02_40020 [Methylobacterium oxalidis]|uniref:Uncharacterized protein n=2 Tax=Methylobacterium oxalidis TaxID=944322 RepID=A0A512J7L8_9HYPH|nr:hypothetical protein [Methylobacterium oxalidis]GEP05964.1 hypothetical protein MOX02_40020 [Methylobacterium oxalidis]GLS66957.1 hypothetical protein GCM10007888_53400 [Methylobacterium oxalidis]